MTPYIFDGKAYALEKERELAIKVSELRSEGIVPKLISIIVGDDPASVLYVNLKKKAAERIGCELTIKNFSPQITKENIVTEIKKHNEDKRVHGIMVQLPLPKNFSKNDRYKILNSIFDSKDIDGLKPKSQFTPPTAKAVLEILNKAIGIGSLTGLVPDGKVTVVGAKGFIGKQIVRALRKKLNIEVIEVSKKTENYGQITKKSDVLISVTGVSNLIKVDMVKSGAILIDVGSPKGDIGKEAYSRASFVSPVPGGVGPMTINCLLENLVESASS